METMKLNGLFKIYKIIKNENLTYGIFDFKTNGVCFNVYFDIGKSPFRLGFLPVGFNTQIWLDVKYGFEINPNLKREDYYNLINLLGLETDNKNPFSTFNFFKQFDKAIPNSIKMLSDSQRVEITKSVTSIEEEDRVLFDGLIEWDKGNTGNKRSLKNLEKTRLLLPDTYEEIKNKNVSVRYKSI